MTKKTLTTIVAVLINAKNSSKKCNKHGINNEFIKSIDSALNELMSMKNEESNKYIEIRNIESLPFAAKVKLIATDGHEYPAVVFGHKLGFTNGSYMLFEDIKKSMKVCLVQ